MAKKKRGGGHGGGHGWYVSFADLMGLMMSFFVMLVAFSTMDNNKLKIVAGSMRIRACLGLPAPGLAGHAGTD
jgi:chemotaxis protein MotB